MIGRIGTGAQDTLRSGTFDAVLISTYMYAATANNALAQADFLPQNVNIKVTLRRDNSSKTIMSDNLLILGSFNTLLHGGQHEFLNGIDKVYPSSGVKATKLRTVKLRFGSAVRVNPGDDLIIEVTPSQVGTFTSNVDATSSYVEFTAIRAIGYETGIPETKSEVVQASVTNQPFNPGDNITSLAVLNFDKNDLSSEVLTNLSLGSDKLDTSMTFNTVMALKAANYPVFPASRYGTSLPISGSPTVSRGLDYSPQSFVVFHSEDNELDQCRLDLNFNSVNVTASQNYVVYRRYSTDAETLQAAATRAQKHQSENIQKVIEASK